MKQAALNLDIKIYADGKKIASLVDKLAGKLNNYNEQLVKANTQLVELKTEFDKVKDIEINVGYKFTEKYSIIKKVTDLFRKNKQNSIVVTSRCCYNCSKQKELKDIILICKANKNAIVVAYDNVCNLHEFKALSINM